MLYKYKYIFSGFNSDAKNCMIESFSFLIVVQSDQTVFNTVVQQSVTEKSIVCTVLFRSSLLNAEACFVRCQR